MDGKLLVTGCDSSYIYTWDDSAIIKEAGLLLDIADATPRSVPKIKDACQIP
ncbi:uncharacterized protein EDB93DRAFT_1254718 [Suillus bovinus]|uniref:uncharacterized protein n=1 Tax=Suillus bovinus TaxID=48563 RepID=UPI001B86DC9D|nr:uncharacterized protein EDB93DRAFT_1254718 [Suillus bovinus]KAG2133821.1 hypothetical protein EDB93DRAFT_1254718 [Suillus bovinus]